MNTLRQSKVYIQSLLCVRHSGQSQSCLRANTGGYKSPPRRTQASARLARCCWQPQRRGGVSRLDYFLSKFYFPLFSPYIYILTEYVFTIEIYWWAILVEVWDESCLTYKVLWTQSVMHFCDNFFVRRSLCLCLTFLISIWSNSRP